MSKLAQEKADFSVSEHKEHADLDALPEIGSPERVAAERKLVRKLDTRLLPTIFLIFVSNHVCCSQHNTMFC